MAVTPYAGLIAEIEGELTFSVETDINSTGRFGPARLLVGSEKVLRLESSPLGEQIVAAWPLRELGRPRVHDLVGASSIIADCDGGTVELIRASSPLRTRLGAAQRCLEALSKGEPMPELEEEPRVCAKCGRPLPQDSNVCTACIDRGKTFIRLFSFAREHRMRIVLGTIYAVVGASLDLLPPYFTKLLVDRVLTERQVRFFLPIIGGLVVARLAAMCIQVARGRNVAFLGMRIAVNVRTALFVKLQALSLGFYDRRNVGSIMSRMINDTGALYDVLIDGVPVLLNQGVLLIALPIAMFVVSWQLALVALAPIPIIMLAVRWFRLKMTRVFSRFWHAWSRLGGALNGVLQGMRVVKAYRGESREVVRFERRVDELATLGYTAESTWATMFPFVMFLMSASAFVVWWVGGHQVLGAKLTLGALMAVISYQAMLQQPLMMLQRIVDWTTRTMTAAERVFEVLDTPEDITDAPQAVAIEHMRGDVRFEGVHFSYDKVRSVLHGVDFEVKAGEMIGIVGHSGSGKSTLMNLLLRFYDPSQGRVFVDGVDLRDIRLEDFRRQVGIVLQESYLFPGSIRQNIAYGKPDADLEPIMAAAKAANAHEFILNFPDGYDSYVGERGQRLSGGERQRISMARAILHNPRILVLDEATSSVDTQTERLIQEALDHLTEGRTTFVIAHRLSTLRSADRLIVMDQGKIAEVGTHDELMQRENGIYAKLVNMQLEIQRMRENYIGGGDDADEEPSTGHEETRY